MSWLVPCSSCRRHLRHTEAVCPFCAAPVQASATEPRPARSRGAKRAVLFAMGVSVAASACETDNTIAIYGAPFAPEGGRGGGVSSGGSGGTAGVGTAGGSGGVAGTGGSAGSDDESSDAGDGDAGDSDAGDNAGDNAGNSDAGDSDASP